MIILKEQLATQTFKFIPRELNADSMVIKLEGGEQDETINITPTTDRYYLSVTEALTLVENNFYQLTVYNGSDVVYKDKIFCTNQVIEDYTVNKDEYVQHSTSNEWVIID